MKRPFTTIAAVFFVIFSLMHFLRLVFGWEVTFNGMTFPIWVSIPAFMLTALLALMLWLESRK
ncbi:MAG: hypothetical protein A2X59_06585 [Nitrospirae bacterium GWC2_42_7]|nr:MAG: hypothetical protein A2X59_06585 [Nitrospirae bacterium GWC2_42_7]